ncbi:nitroreductase family protein [Kibdelosporangium philippinense]|uniref:Nitroreductase family protein n=1 Tax=Kibdelosporangium philippinense TaxID=211113 RepID=A0ABS8Z9W8_9PSEU|nr:nitroreductase family protein [Kibdelosporangium philippinense]MCE7004658.1 nitroreductase family protein [Kibdelosporangium philippinense]
MSFWAPGEVRLIFQAVAQAPSVHNIQPWVLELHERSVLLFERWDHAIPRHDPKGRDRLMSCGAALANLELAMRYLGWETTTTLFPDRAHPDLVASVSAVRPRTPTSTERDRYLAIPYRRSQRFKFDGEPLSADEIRAVRHSLAGERVSYHRVTGRQEAEAVATLSEHSAQVLRHDHRYLHELQALTIDRGKARLGLPADRIAHGLFGGLVHSGDPVPEHETLTSLIARECVFVVETVDDTSRDHVAAGKVIQLAWLTATRLGLAASLITQSLQVPEVRAGLSEKLQLPGFPHALMRFGRATRVPKPSPRRQFADVVRES